MCVSYRGKWHAPTKLCFFLINSSICICADLCLCLSCNTTELISHLRVRIMEASHVKDDNWVREPAVELSIYCVWTAVQVNVSVEAQNGLQPQYVAAPYVWMKVCCLVLRQEFLQSQPNCSGLFTGPFLMKAVLYLYWSWQTKFSLQYTVPILAVIFKRQDSF